MRLCSDCQARVENHALRPLEWFNLARNHSPKAYHLGEAFYEDDTGEARQPDMDVDDVDEFPIPAVEEMEGNVAALVDLANSRWGLDYWYAEELVEALRRLPAHELLEEIQRRVASTTVIFIERTAYSIAGLVLGRQAEAWIRERARVSPPIHQLAFACAHCLPPEEGFRIVAEARAWETGRWPVDDCVSALGNFPHRLVLDWMEENIFDPENEGWGRIVAFCGADWRRIQQWLDTNSSLGLVGLNILNTAWKLHAARLHRVPPRLFNRGSEAEMRRAIENYAAQNKGTREQTAAEDALTHLDAILKLASAP